MSIRDVISAPTQRRFTRRRGAAILFFLIAGY
ncbi:MAG: hypothetical protein K0R44_3775 [Thermomicrobiales bacterium]|nr:hypothetical protein [Thermomicrobiales bacterium]